MSTFTKIVHIGRTACGNTFAKIVFNDNRLSITGVEGPKANGNAAGSSGQIFMTAVPTFKDFAPGWNAEKLAQFAAIWEDWHLNDMSAGSPAQTAFLKANPVTWKYPGSHYDSASHALQSAGLNPDPDYLRNGKPYKYGSAWLSRDVPADVIQFLQSLPDATVQPAWI